MRAVKLHMFYSFYLAHALSTAARKSEVETYRCTIMGSYVLRHQSARYKDIVWVKTSIFRGLGAAVLKLRNIEMSQFERFPMHKYNKFQIRGSTWSS